MQLWQQQQGPFSNEQVLRWHILSAVIFTDCIPMAESAYDAQRRQLGAELCQGTCGTACQGICGTCGTACQGTCGTACTNGAQL